MRAFGRGVRRPPLGIVSAGAIREWPALGRPRARFSRGKPITRSLRPLVLAVADPTRMAGISPAGVGLGGARSHKRYGPLTLDAAPGELHAGGRDRAGAPHLGDLSRASAAAGWRCAGRRLTSACSWRTLQF